MTTLTELNSNWHLAVGPKSQSNNFIEIFVTTPDGRYQSNSVGPSVNNVPATSNLIENMNLTDCLFSKFSRKYILQSIYHVKIQFHFSHR